MAQAQNPERTEEDKIRHLFSKLSLKQDDSRKLYGTENNDYKFMYFSRQNLSENYSLCGWHSYIWVMWTILQKRWETVGPASSRVSLHNSCIASYLVEMQSHDCVHRQLCAEKILATLESLYSEGPSNTKKETDRVVRQRKEKQLVSFKADIQLSEDYLRGVVPGNLTSFIKEVHTERHSAKVFLLAIVRVLFNSSVDVQEMESRASRLKEYVREMVRMSGKHLPCLTGEHQPISGRHYHVEKVVEVLAQLPTEFAIPELCMLSFKSTRWEFLQELCGALLKGPGSWEDIKHLMEPTVLHQPSDSTGGLFAQILDRILELLGKVAVQNLLEVACASSLLLEPVFSSKERIEMYGLFDRRLTMLFDLWEATQIPGDTTPGPVLQEIEEVKDEVDLIFNGKDFYDLYFDPKLSKNSASSKNQSSCSTN